jgi:hypothetical protein
VSEDWRNGPGGSEPSGRRLSRWWSGRTSWLAAGCGAGSIVLAASLVAFVDTSPGHSVTDGDASVALADGSATSPDEDGAGSAKTKGPSDPAEADGTTTTSARSSGSADRPTEAGADPDHPSAPPADGSVDGSEADPGTGAAAPTTSPPTTAPPAEDTSTTPVGGTKDGNNQVSGEGQAPAITGFAATRVSGTCSDTRQVMTKFEWSSTNSTGASVGPQGGATMGVDPTSHLLTCAVRKSAWVLTVSGPGGTTSAVATAPG